MNTTKTLAMLALFLSPGLPAAAAPAPPASASVFTIEEDAVTCLAVFAWRDLEALLPLDDNGDDELSDREFRSWREDLASLAEVFFAVYRGDEPLIPDSVSLAQAAGRSGTIEFRIRYAAPAISTWESVDVAFESLPDFPAGHRHRLEVVSAAGDLLHGETLGAAAPLSPPAASVTPAKPAPATGSPATASSSPLSARDPDEGTLYLLLAGLSVGIAAFITGILVRRQSSPPATRF